MRRLGISIYPEKSTYDEMKAYIDMAAKNGFDRIFTCLLSVDRTQIDKIVSDFKAINQYAESKGMLVIADVSPSVFKDLDISYKDLGFFKSISAHGIRLDLGFSGNEEALMTYNDQSLFIEINMSNDTHYLETIMDYLPNKDKLIGCHNFYPHRFSGLKLPHFYRCTERFKKHGLITAAFVTSQSNNSFGPWPVTDGLPTLECHRNLPLAVQVKHYISMNGLIDDVIISNCYASESELEAVGRLRRDVVSFEVTLTEDLPDIEKEIILDMLHFNRGDVSDHLIRSTQSRVKFRGYDFKVINPVAIRRGDIIIESSTYGHYAGELQIAMQDMPNSGRSSVVGHICPEEHFILDIIKPWQKFVFIRARK